MRNQSTLLFVVYQTTLLILDSVNVIEFNIPYAIVASLLLLNSAYQSYLKSQEIPRLSAEIDKKLAEQDKKLSDIKSELSRYSISKVQNQAAAFKF